MKTTELTQDTFDATIQGADRPVLVDFYADWCGPCKMLGPVIDQVAEEQDGKALVAKVNIEEAPEVASRFGVRSIPALFVFKGGRPVASANGVQPKAAIENLIAQAG